MKKSFRFLCAILVVAYFLLFFEGVPVKASSGTANRFSDVPETSYAFESIHRLRSLGITNGVGDNKFGYGKILSRGEFVTFLVRIMDWEQISPPKGSFSDNQDSRKFYYSPVETAVVHGVIPKEDLLFRPEEPITREEAAIMVVNCLGYGSLAKRLSYLEKPFPDVTRNIGYVTIAKDFGIFNGTSKTTFSPDGYALREQVAAILIRLVDALESPLKELNGFYAINSSPQKDMISSLTSVCFGWSKLSYDSNSGSIVLNTSRTALGYNDYYLPVGFSQRLESSKQAGVTTLLMVQAVQGEKMTDPETGLSVGIPEYILTHPNVYRNIIQDIVSSLNNIELGDETGSFDGVVIDFEGLKGSYLKDLFNVFLKELKAALDKDAKKLFVAVHPLMHPKVSASSFDGYDYRTIGALADRVILMAHDYDAKRLTESDMARGVTETPLTPIENVYYALKMITDADTGIQEKNKIMLQISFDWKVWNKKDGKTLNSTAKVYNLENFINLLNSGKDISYGYSKTYENPYLKYTDSDSGIESIVWYENTQSVLAKINLAKLFGIQGISLWRLGQIPDYVPGDGRELGMDVWQNILKEMEK